MRTIKVVTGDGNAYYDIVSRLKKTHLKFSSVPRGQSGELPDDVVITSRAELPELGRGAVAIEDLDDDPMVMEGQLLALQVVASRRELLIGIDPGSRIGVAVFYGGAELGSVAASSVEDSVHSIVNLVQKVPWVSVAIKVGGGEPKSSFRLVRMLRERLPRGVSIEVVDESRTSRRGETGAMRDQRAAARIAFRKGRRFNREEW